MKKVLFLAVTALAALPGVSQAVTCNILPYQNQCQGSNYWPKPANWPVGAPAYNAATCQPTAPAPWPATYAYLYGGVRFAPDDWAAAGTAMCNAAGWHGGWGISSTKAICLFYGNQYTQTLTKTAWKVENTDYFDVGSPGRCGYLSGPPAWAGAGVYCDKRDYSTGTMKPSDGQCSLRWTNSGKTATQIDPLDPDCPGSGCGTNGVCTLK